MARRAPSLRGGRARGGGDWRRRPLVLVILVDALLPRAQQRRGRPVLRRGLVDGARVHGRARLRQRGAPAHGRLVRHGALVAGPDQVLPADVRDEPALRPDDVFPAGVTLVVRIRTRNAILSTNL